MCGRYTLFKLDQLLKDIPGLEVPFDLFARYNIAPTQPVPAISNDHPNRLAMFHWGLVPSWARDPALGSRMFNARAETLAEKPSFRTAIRRRRCLIPADGFYEWRKEPGRGKTPMYIHLKSGHTITLAGLWDMWHSPEGAELPSLTIITTAANLVVEPIHDRMPVIVAPADRARWLTADEVEPAALADVLKPYPTAEMEAYVVPPPQEIGKPVLFQPAGVRLPE